MKHFMLFGEDDTLYREFPVDIDTFIESDYFIGKYTENGKRIYPFWREKLREMFNTSNPTKYTSMYNATAAHTGKTLISMIAFTYTMYLHMCLNNPNKIFYGNDKTVYSFVILTTSKEDDAVAKNVFFNIISKSPWFCYHGKSKVNILNNIVNYEPLSSFEIIFTMSPDDLFGRYVLAGYYGWTVDKFDNTLSSKVVSTMIARTASRNNYGKVIIDFTLSNTNINIEYVKHNSKNENDTVFWVNGSQFDIKPEETFDWTKSFLIEYSEVNGYAKVITSEDITERLKLDNIKFIKCPISVIQAAKLDTENFLLLICGIQVNKKRIGKENLSKFEALKELLNGKAIKHKKQTSYYALNSDGIIRHYDCETNHLLEGSFHVFDVHDILDLQQLFDTCNFKCWMSFDNPNIKYL